MKRECVTLLETLRRHGRWLLPVSPLLLMLLVSLLMLLEKSAARALRDRDYNMTTGCPLNRTLVCNDATRLWIYDEQRFAVLALCALGWLLLLAVFSGLLVAVFVLARWVWRERYELSMLTTPEPDVDFDPLGSGDDDEELVLESLEEEPVGADKGHKTD